MGRHVGRAPGAGGGAGLMGDLKDKVAKILGVEVGSNSLKMSTDKMAERRNCGCFWLYLAAQPVVAPCAEHLARLEDTDGE